MIKNNVSNIIIDFSVDKSIELLLGFGNASFTDQGFHESSNVVYILFVNSMLLHCMLTEGSYLNEDWKSIFIAPPLPVIIVICKCASYWQN